MKDVERARVPGRYSAFPLHIAPKTGDVVQGIDDVFSLAWTSASGYGDPLERDPDRVVRDIADANMTVEWARERTGVCLDERGALDREKTDELRSKIITQRLAVANERQTALESRPESVNDRAVSEGLALVGAGDDAVYVCRKCRTVIQTADKNYKTSCIKRTTAVQEVGLAPIDPKLFIDDKMVYREYFCPGCGLLFQGDFTRMEDADIWDIRLFSTLGNAG